ncbi:hypothetical protein RclHR1_16820003 [Rhizophagus clarus]|uniref:Uncharacterized protein n=1 Tax=Rhizophagus clarus TaxID=94130 RepID=A0A2Z6QZ42_9GLOM|nr:hypothetical protein RclHR1_16820003 [Rhizophagus clarus]
MSAIVTKYVAEHKLNKDISNEELSQHTPALFELLTDKLKNDKGCQCFRKGYNFSRKQAFVLVPDWRIYQSKSQVTLKERGDEARKVNICDTKSVCQISDIIPEQEIIRETAQRIMWDSLGEKNFSKLRIELQKLNVSEAIIKAIKIPEITTLSNKIQKKKSLLYENEGIHYPDHFSLESVKERLDLYDVHKTPTMQALADVIIILCIRLSEIKDLHISNRSVTKYSKN